MERPPANPSAREPKLKGLNGVVPQIQSLIEVSRRRVVSAANLTLVWLY